MLRLLVAFLLALPAGWERERSRRASGLRTYPLVALAACAFLSVGRVALAEDVADQSDVVAALLAGIGFIAGGAIMRANRKLRGLADATGLWVATGIGAAAAYDLFGLAAVMALLMFIALWPRRAFKNEDSG